MAMLNPSGRRCFFHAICALLLALFPGAMTAATAFAETPAAVVQRELWNFDDSDLMWVSNAARDEAKSKNTTAGVPGWVDYRFETPRSGWYELWQTGVAAEWQRDVFVDGKLEGRMITSDPTLDRDGKMIKELNLFLTAGQHTLRYRRLDHPASLPSRWELRDGVGRPEASLRIRAVGDPIARVGETIRCTVEGGGDPNASTRYEFFVQPSGSTDAISIGAIEFTASAEMVAKPLEFKLPRQAVWHIVVKTNGNTLRPADHKAPDLFAVDTAARPARAGDAKLTPIIEIDCVAQTINGQPAILGDNYFEQHGPTRIVDSPIGRYRASNGRGPGTNWGLDGFSYRFKLPEKQVLYKLEVDYPDDDRRTMGFWINDGAKLTNATGTTATGGVETGDIYPLSGKVRTHEAFFYPRAVDQVVFAALNLTPAGMGAAASKARIYRVDEPLPAATFAETIHRREVGYWFEEPGRWLRHFGGENEGSDEQLRCLDRWGQFAQFQGARLLWPTVNIYQANYYPSDVLEGYFSRPYNYLKLTALMAERYGCQFVPDFHISGKNWFDVHTFGVQSVKTANNQTDVRFNSPADEQYVIRSDSGAMRFASQPFLYNALHPKVQETYIAALGEAADMLGQYPAFKGISSRLMITWMWQGYNALPSLKWGYDDWTVAQFEKETGIRVPVDAQDADRYRKRFEFLTGVQKQAWVDWRCKRIFDYHCRLRDRIRKAKPDANLYLTCLGIDPAFTLSRDPQQQLIESGIDPKMYEGADGIVLVPAASFGRRYSTPSFDAVAREKSFSDLFIRLAGLGKGDIATTISSAYFEANANLDWTKLGGQPYAAFDSCEPSAEHERELFAAQLADVDTSTFIVGANGTFAGRPAWMRPWFERFNAIPAKRFEKAPTAQDPVAIWQSRDDKGLTFYAVNRLGYRVDVTLTVHGVDTVEVVGTPTSSSAMQREADGAIIFALDPYMLQVFRASGAAVSLDSYKVKVPVEVAQGMRPAVAFASQFKEQLSNRQIAVEMSQQEVVKAMADIDKASAAFKAGELAQVRNALFTPSLLRAYESIGRYPTGLLERQTPLGFNDTPDRPTIGAFEEVESVGDPRGRLDAIDDLHFDVQGKLWASSGAQLMQFDADGKYVRSLRVLDESDYLANGYRWDKMGPPLTMVLATFAVTPNGDVIAAGRGTALHRFDGASGRRLGSIDGRSSWATRQVAVSTTIIGADDVGNVYVAGDKGGVFKYQPDGSIKGEFENGTSNRVTDLAFQAAAVDGSGRLYLASGSSVQIVEADGSLGKKRDLSIEPKLMAVSNDGSILAVANGTEVTIRRVSGDIGVATIGVAGEASALAIGPRGDVVVGFKSAVRGSAAVRLHAPDGRPMQQAAAFIKSPDADLPSQPTQLKSFKEKLYYLADDRLVELDTANGRPPKVAAELGTIRAVAFAFGDSGELFIASDRPATGGKPSGLYLAKLMRAGDRWNNLSSLNDGKSLLEWPESTIDDIACDEQGRIIFRTSGERPQKGPTPRMLSAWDPKAGKIEKVADIGATENAAEYGVHCAADGRTFIADAAGRRVLCVTPAGAIAWQRQFLTQRSHGSLPLRSPVAVTIDRHDRLWITDSAANQIVCLDAKDGRFLTTVGHQGTVDDPAGGMFMPSGIVAANAPDGRDWIYVLDAGNRRILRFSVGK